MSVVQSGRGRAYGTQFLLRYDLIERLFGWTSASIIRSERTDPDGKWRVFDFDQSFVEKVFRRAAHRVPCLAEAVVEPRRCRAGLYEMTPDHHAIIGEAPGVRGLYLANGFSGHGVMHSPATGRIISEMTAMHWRERAPTSGSGWERPSEAASTPSW